MMKAPVAHDGYGRAAKRLLRWALVIGGVVGLLCLGPGAMMMMMMLMGGHDRSDRAQLDLANLRQALNAYHRQKGVWPPEPRWSEALVDARLLEQSPLDPWDHPYQYRLETADGGPSMPVLSCLGRDGVADSEDDLPRRTTFAP